MPRDGEPFGNLGGFWGLGFRRSPTVWGLGVMWFLSGFRRGSNCARGVWKGSLEDFLGLRKV